jgi:hypothetical protein
VTTVPATRRLAGAALCAAVLALPAAFAPGIADARPSPVRVGEGVRGTPASGCAKQRPNVRRARSVWRACA